MSFGIATDLVEARNDNWRFCVAREMLRLELTADFHEFFDLFVENVTDYIKTNAIIWTRLAGRCHH